MRRWKNDIAMQIAFVQMIETSLALIDETKLAMIVPLTNPADIVHETQLENHTIRQ